MRYRIAASDIDDTLLRSDLTISQSTKDTILNFQARGGVFVLSTGRMYPSARALAGELGLPVIVHDRDAHGDCMAIVREYPQVTGVFHCFSGSAEMARELIGLGWMISFTGVLTYRNARKAVEAAQAVPLEKIMIETDSPYMAPEPCRGKRCDSSLVVHTCRRLAEIKGVSLEECARITLENGRRFFSIQEGGNGTA